MSAHTAKQILRRAKPPKPEQGNTEAQLSEIRDWLKANETGHVESPKSKRNTKKTT